MRSVAHPKTAGKIFIIGIACFLCLPFAIRGEIKTKEPPRPLPPGVALRIEAHPKTATIGDPIRLQMDITMPYGYQAEVSRPIAKDGDLFIMDFSSGPRLPPTGAAQAPAKPAPIQAKPIMQHRTQITIAVFKTGTFSFPAIPVKIKATDGREIAAESPPVEIEIRSVLGGKNPSLKDLKKQADIAEPVRWLLWIGLLAACLAAGAIYWHYRRRRRTPLPLTPAQTQSLLDLAEGDLRNLLARGFPGSGEEKAFYIALSEIAKRILEAGYQIHAAEQTTSEIMNSLEDRPEMDSESRNRIEGFLSRCDLVKFAKHVPSGAEHEAAAQEAQSILAQARVAVGSRQSAAGSDLRLPEN